MIKFLPVLSNQMISSLPADMEAEKIHAGTYVYIADVYHPERYICNYHKLMKFIEDNQMTVTSDVYELFGALSYSPDQQEELIIELKVRVC